MLAVLKTFIVPAGLVCLAAAGLSGFAAWNEGASKKMQNLEEMQKIKESMVLELRHEVREMLRNETINYSNGEYPVNQAASVPDFEKALEDAAEKGMDRALDHRSAGSPPILSNAELGMYTAGGSGEEGSEAEIPDVAAGGPGGQSAGQPVKDGASAQEIPGLPKRVKEKAVERTLIQEGGLLLPRGRLQLEPSFTMAHFSSNRINVQGFSILPVLVIGEISTQAVQRDILIGAMSIKYGLWHRLQAEVKAPYRSEFDRITSNLGDETTRDARGIGDIEAGLSYQLLNGHDILPDTIFSLGMKAPTGDDPYRGPIGLGTGHWGGRASLVSVKSSDPAVVFGTLTYSYNAPREMDDFGEIDPGDSIGYGLGTAIALSYQTAINFQFEHSLTRKSRRDGVEVNGTFVNSATLKTGFTWTVNENLGIDTAVGIGLTTDAPDYVFELRMPYSF